MTIFIVADRVSEARSWEGMLRSSRVYPDPTFVHVLTGQELLGRRLRHNDEVHVVRWPTLSGQAEYIQNELDRLLIIQGAVMREIGPLGLGFDSAARFRIVIYDVPRSLDREAVEEWLG